MGFFYCLKKYFKNILINFKNVVFARLIKDKKIKKILK